MNRSSLPNVKPVTAPKSLLQLEIEEELLNFLREHDNSAKINFVFETLHQKYPEDDELIEAALNFLLNTNKIVFNFDFKITLKEPATIVG